MAKATAQRIGSPSRVRFIVLEAELHDGDLGQITQAIQNALAPAQRPALRLTSSTAKQQSKEAEIEVEELVADEAEEEITAPETNRASDRPRTPRKPRSPKVLELDLTSDVSLASYAQSKKTDTDVSRNLVIAAWFKLHRNLDSITADHVYTGYRSLGWPTAITDFAKPLKNLKQRQFFDGKDGNYSINHLGIARVDKPD